MTSSLFWDGMQRILVVTDVSGQNIGPIFKGKAIPWSLQMGPTDYPETSVTIYQSILRKIPERRRSVHLWLFNWLRTVIIIIIIIIVVANDFALDIFLFLLH
jgi:hypothetical protein